MRSFSVVSFHPNPNLIQIQQVRDYLNKILKFLMKSYEVLLVELWQISSSFDSFFKTVFGSNLLGNEIFRYRKSLGWDLWKFTRF